MKTIFFKFIKCLNSRLYDYSTETVIEGSNHEADVYAKAIMYTRHLTITAIVLGMISIGIALGIRIFINVVSSRTAEGYLDQIKNPVKPPNGFTYYG